jgi:hypothetical protein
MGKVFVSGSEAGAADDGPALDAVAFAALPVGVFGIDGQAAFDHEVQRREVLKVDVDGVMVAGEVDLTKLRVLPSASLKR